MLSSPQWRVWSWVQLALGLAVRAGSKASQQQGQQPWQQQERRPPLLRHPSGAGSLQQQRQQSRQHSAASKRTRKQRQPRQQQWLRQRSLQGRHLLGLVQVCFLHMARQRRGLSHNSKPGCQSSCWICLTLLLAKQLQQQSHLLRCHQQQQKQHERVQEGVCQAALLAVWGLSVPQQQQAQHRGRLGGSPVVLSGHLLHCRTPQLLLLQGSLPARRLCLQ